MQTTDPAWRYRNQCIQLMVECFNIPSWQAFKYAGRNEFTDYFTNGWSATQAVSDFFNGGGTCHN